MPKYDLSRGLMGAAATNEPHYELLLAGKLVQSAQATSSPGPQCDSQEVM